MWLRPKHKKIIIKMKTKLTNHKANSCNSGVNDSTSTWTQSVAKKFFLNISITAIRRVKIISEIANFKKVSLSSVSWMSTPYVVIEDHSCNSPLPSLKSRETWLNRFQDNRRLDLKSDCRLNQPHFYRRQGMHAFDDLLTASRGETHR